MCMIFSYTLQGCDYHLWLITWDTSCLLIYCSIAWDTQLIILRNVIWSDYCEYFYFLSWQCMLHRYFYALFTVNMAGSSILLVPSIFKAQGWLYDQRQEKYAWTRGWASMETIQIVEKQWTNERLSPIESNYNSSRSWSYYTQASPHGVGCESAVFLD